MKPTSTSLSRPSAPESASKRLLGENAKAQKIAIECMANLNQLPPKGATLVLGPLQLKDGSGSPLSVLAFIP